MTEYVTAGKGLTFALTQSFEEVAKSGGGVVGVGHVLRACVARLARTLPSLRPFLGSEVPAESSSKAVSTSTGESPIDVETRGILRATAWAASGLHDVDVVDQSDDLPLRWSGTVATMLRLTLETVSAAGLTHAGPAHFIQSVLDGKRDPDPADRHALTAELDRLNLLGTEAQPLTSMVRQLGKLGYFAHPLWLRPLGYAMRLSSSKNLPSGPIVDALSQQAALQSVRLAHRAVSPLHFFLAIALFGEQLSTSPAALRRTLLPHNNFDPVLRQHGVDLRSLFDQMGDLQGSGSEAATIQATHGFLASQYPAWTADWYPVWTASTIESLSAAREIANNVPGADHLLIALLDQPDDALRDLFDRSNADIVAVRDAISGLLGLPR